MWTAVRWIRINFVLFLHVFVCVCLAGYIILEASGQLAGIGSILPLCVLGVKLSH